jgi:dihydroxyacetone kinase-like protein
MTIARDQIVQWLRCYAAVIASNRAYLTQLDSAIGDADHGVNMDRGFRAVMDKLPGVVDKDISTILKTTGMTLVSTVGGAGGPLYGTLFLQAGAATAGKSELNTADVLAMFDAAVKGVVMRGKANLNDKTMVDALTPAVEALRAHVDDDLPTAMNAAVDAAEAGMKATTPLVAKKGRASYLGERSAGHQDPGATSSFLLLQCARDAFV